MDFDFEEWLRSEISRENHQLDTLRPYSPDYIAHAYRLNGLEECLRRYLQFAPKTQDGTRTHSGLY